MTQYNPSISNHVNYNKRRCSHRQLETDLKYTLRTDALENERRHRVEKTLTVHVALISGRRRGQQANEYY